jgi:hypothetical protein
MIPARVVYRLFGDSHLVRVLVDVIRLMWTALIVVGGFLITIELAASIEFMFRQLHMNDFGKFYYSTRLFLSGEPMYGPSPATLIPVGDGHLAQFWNMDPPAFHLLLLPFAGFQPGAALTGWFLLNLGALAQSLRLIASELGLRWTTARAVHAALVIGALAATRMVAVTGQLSFLLMLGVTCAWQAARRQQWTRAAAVLGVCTAIKPFLGLFLIYLALRRKGTAVVAMGGAIIAVHVVGVVVFGLQAHRDWLMVLGAVDWTWAAMNGSLRGIAARSLASSPTFVPLIDRPELVSPIAYAASAAVAVGTWRAMHRDESPGAVDRGFYNVLMASQLLSPLGWTYYVFNAAGPAAAMVASSIGRPIWRRDLPLVVGTLALFLPIGVTTLQRDVGVGSIGLGSSYGWALVALWWAGLEFSRTARSR